MNNIKIDARWYIVMAGFIGCLMGCTEPVASVSVSALDQRLDSLLAKMSMQEKIEQLYYQTDGNERLGIPQFKGSDGPHGIGNGAKGFSSFPVTIGMAATWDPDLITRVGRAISLEQASRGKDRIAGPTLDLLIDPRIGRAPETIGEDPFLGGRISEAFVLGQQSTSVFGSVKHYNLNTYEINRRTNDYLSDERSLVEFWGYHWKRTVQQGGAFSIMCAYNWVNGDKCAENAYLIKTLLRDHWGFDYYTMSDWGGFAETGKALAAELDFCEGNDLYIKELPDGVASGRFDSSLVERATRNILRTKLVTGMIDGVPAVADSVVDSKAHRELVYESGLKGLVLLKNEDGILPLDPEALRSVAVIGPNAAVLPLDGNSSSKVVPSYTIPVSQALTTALGARRVTYAKGCNINDADERQFAEAIALAQAAEYVVFVGGLDQTVEGEGYFLDKEADEKGGGVVTRPDRPSGTVELPGQQNALIKALAAVNPNLILVVLSGGPCSVTPVIDDLKGLIYGFYPGQEAGRAITDVLLGRYNPSGKLPATIPKHDQQIMPISPDFRNLVSRGVGYRWFDAQDLRPEFAFGHGLSYTTFAYSDLSISPAEPKVGDFVEVSFDLTNTGDRVGEEVAQLYLSTGAITPNLAMPDKQLRGFKKVKLAPGESQRVTLTLTPEELYVYHRESASYQVPAGEFVVKIGGASDQLPLQAPFTLAPAPGKADLSVVNIRSLPAFPKIGEPVVFMASLINNGTAATVLGEGHTLHVDVDGRRVATYHARSVSIPIGGMAQVCAQGIAGSDWVAQAGTHRITATIETSTRQDAHPQNNVCQASLTLPDGKIIPHHIADIIDQHD
jgi:beta-glucosidase